MKRFTMTFLTNLFTGVLVLLVLTQSSCDDDDADHTSADDSVESMPLDDLFSSANAAVVLLAVDVDTIYLMKKGTEEQHVIVKNAVGWDGLFALELVPNWTSVDTFGVENYYPRDGDSHSVSARPASGTIKFSGATSPREIVDTESIAEVLDYMKLSLSVDGSMIIDDFESRLGLEALATVELDVQCGEAEQPGGQQKWFDAQLEAIAIHGTSGEVDEWWATLGQLIPDV